MRTAVEIYKLLPKTNCGTCGTPTCFGFAAALFAFAGMRCRAVRFAAEAPRAVFFAGLATALTGLRLFLAFFAIIPSVNKCTH